MALLKLALDHLVVAASTLPQGVAYIEKLLGVEMSPGGQHVFMGTHNTVLRLGADCYLEVIAVDPSLRAPQRPRWFGLDNAAMQASLAATPRLIHWVANTKDIVAAQAKMPELLGPVVAASRGNLNWKITIPENGTPPLNGIFPTLIEWPEGAHVASKMPDQGCVLESLVLHHPQAEIMMKDFSMPDKRLHHMCSDKTVLFATIKTPSGRKILG